MKTYKQRTDSILTKVEKIKKKRRKTVWVSVVSSLCAVLILANVAIFLPQTFVKFDNNGMGGNMMEAMPESSTMHVTSDMEWTEEPFDPSYERIVSQIKGVLANNSNSKDEQAPSYSAGQGNPQAPEEGGTSMEDANVSQKPTAMIENSVVGGNLFQRTDAHIFYINKAKNVRQSHQILVYSIAGESSEKVSSYTLKKDVYLGEEYVFIGRPTLYLSTDGNTLTVVAPCKTSGEITQYYTAIISVDVSDPTTLLETNRTYLSGSYQSSRMVDGALFISTRFSVSENPDFMVESTFLPQYGGLKNRQSVQANDILYPEEQSQHAIYTTLCKIDQKTLQEQGFIAMFSMYTNVVVSHENIFMYDLISGTWGEESSKQTLTRIHVIERENRLEYNGFVEVLGVLKNTDYVEEKAGILYVVTKNSRTNKENNYEIRLSDLELLAQQEGLDAAKNADLIEFYNGTWLDIGGDYRYSLKLETYEQTETGLQSVAVYELECSFSEDSDSYFIDKERGLFGLSARMWSRDNGLQISYLLLQFDGSNWRVLQTKTPCDSESDTRAVLVEGYLYIFSCSTFYVISV